MTTFLFVTNDSLSTKSWAQVLGRDLAENLQHFIETVERIRPAATKGQYVKKIVISGTMTPGVQIAI